MNRLYVVESGFTLTGGMADHRLRLASSHMLALAGALAAQITGDSSFAALAQGLDFKDKEKWIQACAQDLRDHAGQSLVVAGAHLPAEVQAVVYAINVALGNVGKTVDFLQVEASAAVSIKTLADAIKAGSVKTLVVLGGNPVYNAPSDLNWASLQKSVPEVVRHGYYVDETSLASSAHVGATHYLESWGDARTADGTIVAIQPMILPLFSGLTELEVLARIAGETTTDAYTMVYQTITGIAGGEPAAAFRKFLHDGVLAGSGYPKASVNLSAGGLSRLINNAPKFTALSKDNLEVRFTTDQKVDDGRFANNGWLQECPDPITKISWDNAILISPRLAGDLGIAPTGSKLQVARVEAGDF
jgi:molybdopterin-containing oxidoreductase family iron-sulfur binding subunit